MKAFSGPPLIGLLLFVIVAAHPSNSEAGTRIGFGRADLTPPIGVPLGGYGLAQRRLIPWDLFRKYPYAHYLKPSTGVLDPIQAKAMSLVSEVEGAPHRRLIFLSLDLVGITADVRTDLLAKLSDLHILDSELFISATHTHSGPGGVSRNGLWQLVVMDRFLPEIYQSLLDRIAHAIRQSLQNTEEGWLIESQFQSHGLQENRQHPNGPVDSTGRLLLARAVDGRWLGGIVNFAIHGTLLPPDNLEFSGDVPSAIATSLERHLGIDQSPLFPPTVLFINGAEGDIAPIGTAYVDIPLEETKRLLNNFGESFAEQALENISTAKPVDLTWNVRSARIDLPKARFQLRACVGGHNSFGGFFRRWKLNISKVMPRSTRAWQIQLGHLRFLTFPGEPTTVVGDQLRAITDKAAWIFSLTNDHLGYFVTPEQATESGTESCNSFYGARGTYRLLQAHSKLSQEIQKP